MGCEGNSIKVYSAANVAMVEAYWEIGRQIDESSLRRMRQFYQVFPICATLSHKLSFCSEKNDAMAKYSILVDNYHLFASKYMTYLPTEEELKKELERERTIIERSLEETIDKQSDMN
jgi:hypothetical protein